MNAASDDALESAALALEAGDPEAALEALEDVAPDDPDRHVVECLARVDLGDLAGARAAFEVAERGLPADDPDLSTARAELLLGEWRIEAARAELTALVAAEPSPGLLEKLALCLELQGDLDGADDLYSRAQALDVDGVRAPVRLAATTFAAAVEEALSDLPERFSGRLDNVRIVSEPVPFLALVDPSDPGATPPELLGLFVGPTLHDLADGASAELPASIYLFQRNLERIARDEQHLALEIRITLYHEIGHFLGLEEDEVEAMGLG